MKTLFAKIEKGTDRVIGYLSKTKRRWLPKISKHEHLVLRTDEDKKIIAKEFESKYAWQTATHKYYYKIIEV